MVMEDLPSPPREGFILEGEEEDPPIGGEEIEVLVSMDSSLSFSPSSSSSSSSSFPSVPKEIWLDVDIRVLFSPPTIQIKYPSGLGGWVRKGEHNDFLREVNQELSKEWGSLRNRLLLLLVLLVVCSIGATMGFVMLEGGGNKSFFMYLGVMVILGGGVVGIREYMGREWGRYVGRVGKFVDDLSMKRFQPRGVAYHLDFDFVEQHLQLDSHRANQHDHQDPYTQVGRFGTKRLSLVISFQPGRLPYYSS